MLRDERLNREEEEKKRKRVDEVSCLSLALLRVCAHAFPVCTLSLASAAALTSSCLPDREREQNAAPAREKEKRCSSVGCKLLEDLGFRFRV